MSLIGRLDNPAASRRKRSECVEKKEVIRLQQRGRGTNELDVIALHIERADHAF
jgi:hypothetical protein